MVTEVQEKTSRAVNIGEITFVTEFNAVLSMFLGSTFDSQKGSSTSGDLVAKFLLEIWFYRLILS
ncbi:hypothetical protein ACSBR1_041525 [Camellia fascicularis]